MRKREEDEYTIQCNGIMTMTDINKVTAAATDMITNKSNTQSQ